MPGCPPHHLSVLNLPSVISCDVRLYVKKLPTRMSEYTSSYMSNKMQEWQKTRHSEDSEEILECSNGSTFSMISRKWCPMSFCWAFPMKLSTSKGPDSGFRSSRWVTILPAGVDRAKCQQLMRFLVLRFDPTNPPLKWNSQCLQFVGSKPFMWGPVFETNLERFIGHLEAFSRYGGRFGPGKSLYKIKNFYGFIRCASVTTVHSKP